MKFRLLFLAFLMGCTVSTQQKPTPDWLDNKYSLFIHFGLYSHFGGEYKGQPVTSGYSEQIQAFAPIPADVYQAAAKEFNPEHWDPHHVVDLAKKAGMRSVVFTAKHHDGFCMYRSAHTSFNIVEATPYGRDVMAGLAAACQESGMDFGIYFSLIDWHFPQANPMSGHNADPITPEHHRLNMSQVEEILTGYGPISEIWFDMGSLTVEQSRELYNLVTHLQPSCVVSGRLGNDFGDFSVMADNQIPEYHLAVPWQTPASVFKETWGHRRWQERGALQPKVDEKIKSLVYVIGRGGNFLLNIGPRSDGSLVPFEEDVLLEMGRWVRANSLAIYGTQPNPFGQIFPWGEVTTKDNKLYLFVMDSFAGQTIRLPRIQGAVQSVRTLSSAIQSDWTYSTNRGLTLHLPEDFTSCCEVFEVVYRDGYTLSPESPFAVTPHFGHSALNYYAGYKSLIAYEWTVDFRQQRANSSLKDADAGYLVFTQAELGKELLVEVDGKPYEVTLEAKGRRGMPVDSVVRYTDSTQVQWGTLYSKPGRGVFGFVQEEGVEHVDVQEDKGWAEVRDFAYGTRRTMDLPPRRGVLLLQEIWAEEAQTVAVEIGSGNGVYVLLNGDYVTAHCLPERFDYQQELLLLPLKKGSNQLLIKYYNAFEDALFYSIKPVWQWTQYRQRLPFDLSGGGLHTIILRLANPPSAVTPLRAGNVRFEVCQIGSSAPLLCGKIFNM